MQGQLEINLSAIRKNYEIIQEEVGPSCEVAAVVKANAYGCGVAAVAPILKDAGAKTFFVATLPEALELRTIIGKGPTIAMLNGFDAGSAQLYAEEKITPILNSLEDVEEFTKTKSLPKPILHIDTGMNRLGIRPEEIEKFDLEPEHIMSHFACAAEDVEMNNHQFEVFKTLIEKFPKAKKSLANSFGVFQSDQFHFEMVRPGMALYGLNPTPEKSNPMQPVVKLSVPILQVRTALENETCGYSATYRFEKKAKLATVSLGYADGFLRHLSNKGALYWKGTECPIRGRISMDLTIVDLCHVPENDLPSQGDMLEVIGVNQSADDLAESCDTIGYEILTSLSRRYERRYIR